LILLAWRLVMRAALLTVLLLLPASVGLAAPVGAPETRFSLPSQETFAARYALARANADAALPDSGNSRTRYIPSDQGFGIGPIRADSADTSGFGRRHGPKPRYRLEGVSVFGGSIGGSIDGRGAMLSLHWRDSR
jgi:hypothetical protein